MGRFCRPDKAAEEATPIADSLQPIVPRYLQPIRGKTGMLGNTRQHLRSDLFAIMKCKDEVRSARASQHAVRGAGLLFDWSTNAK